MKFIFLLLYKTPFYLAVEKENIEIIQLLLSNSMLDINILSILILLLIIQF